jgi:hypothetical protein
MEIWFQFFIEITIKQIASTHFSLSDVSLMVDLENPWAGYKPCLLPVLLQALLFVFKLISSFSPRGGYI